jgi:hypothetical protein
MPTAVYAGQGAILKATISATLTPIAQVLEMEGPGMQTSTKETTNLSSVVKTYRSQMPDPRTLSAPIQYDPTDTTHQYLTSQLLLWPQPASAWELVFPVAGGTHMASFNAVLTKFSVKGMNQEDNLEADIELQLTGMPTFT